MRDFQASKPGRLRSISVGAKVLYTGFAFSALVGLGVSWRLYGAAVGEEGPAAYYAGASVAAASAPPPAVGSASGGPAIELADDALAHHPIVEQIPERKLLEVTHFHLFSIPVYVLVLGHLWLLAKIPPWLQTAGAALAVVTSGVHIAAPWCTRGHPGLAVLMPLSGAAMLVTLGFMAVVSMVDMWLPQPRGRAGNADQELKS